MEQYGKNGLSGTDFIESEVEEIINGFAQKWGTDDLVELLGECEFALSYNAGRIDQLKAKGLKRLYNAITGINRKNRQIVRDNVQSIQEISLKIQKILLRRIDIVSSAYGSLNDKVNTEIFWTQDVVKELIRKLKNVSIKADLTEWQVNVRNKRMKDGRKYMEASDGVKILLAVSDIFKIVRGQTDLIEESFLETTLNDSLKIPSQIRISDFYRDIISDKDCLQLYVKEEYNYPAGYISDYGRRIYKINSFYSDIHMIEVAQNMGRTLEELCREAYVKKEDCTISPSDLCWKLLEDLADLDRRYQKEKVIPMELPKESKVPEAPIPESPKNSVLYSVLRITPEGRWLFRNKNLSCNKTDFKANYSFKDENDIKTYLEGVSPYMVTVPCRYFEICMSEIKNILLNKTKYVSLADYYMYLWFGNTDRESRKSKRVAMIEYYAHDMYVSAYVVDKSGDSYRKGSQKIEIHYTKTKANIEKAIMSLPVFSGLFWGNESILVFKTFMADKYIDDKLEKIGVRMVDNVWEDILKTTNEELGKIINDMLHVTKEP